MSSEAARSAETTPEYLRKHHTEFIRAAARLNPRPYAPNRRAVIDKLPELGALRRIAEGQRDTQGAYRRDWR